VLPCFGLNTAEGVGRTAAHIFAIAAIGLRAESSIPQAAAV
jgi:hypothetical protein